MGSGKKNREGLAGTHRGIPIHTDAVELYITGGKDLSENAFGKGR
jgi:hypothetical protein